MGPSRRPIKPAPAPKPTDALPKRPPRRPEPEVVDATPVDPPPDFVEAVVVAPPPTREVLWSEDADLPPGPVSPPRSGSAHYEEVEEPFEPVVRRRKKSNRGPLILIGMTILVVLISGAALLFVFVNQKDSEDNLVQLAETQYKDAKYAEAAKSFDELVAKFPGSDKIEKYRFFADLSTLQVVVRSVTNRENPRPAVDKLRAFLDARKDSPFTKPDAYGHDLFDAGKKLGDDVIGHAEDQIKEYASDRSKTAGLTRAEDMLGVGRELLVMLGPVRSKEDSVDGLVKGLDKVKAGIDSERHRLEVIAQVEKILSDPSDGAIEEAKRVLLAEKLADDPAGQKLVQDAEGNFLRRVRYDPDPAAPRALPPASTASLLFAAPVGPSPVPARGPGDDPPTVFLGIARGILYAFDEDTSELLWAARVGPDVFDPPVIARVDLTDGPTDLVVVASNVAGLPAVAGYVLRTGEPRWEQPLPAPAAGPAAVVGNRAFVPLRDKAGTVFVFDLTTGGRIGKMTLGQPAAWVVNRPGTGQLYVAAESRRIYEFDVDAGRDSGNLRPRCVRVMPTEHLAGTLRTPPVILGPPGDEPAPRWFVLCQADGQSMKLRTFALPPIVNLPADAPPILEPLPLAVELSLPGWVRFPPISDGERLAAVTDTGQFRVFGINQPGNKDAALFPYPHPTLPTPPADTPIPGLAVPAEDGAFWVLGGGILQKFRLALRPNLGYAVVPTGQPTPIYNPTQPIQLNPRRDTAFFVVQSPHSGGCRAIAMRLRDGKFLWQRQLGVVPSSDPVLIAGGVVLVDADGGVVAVPPEGAAAARGVTRTPAGWVVAMTPPAASGPTAMITAADGKTVFTVTPGGTGDATKWVIRRATGGKVDHTGTVTAPAALAGRPGVINGTLLLPAADGFVYRLVLGDGRLKPDALIQGPPWADRRLSNPQCYLTVVGEDTFLTSDGGRRMSRWAWPAGGSWADGNGRWEVRERIATPPLLLPSVGGRPARLLVGDATGGVWLYSLDRGDPPIRRWLPGRTALLPAGKVSEFATQTDAAGRQMVVYTVNRKRLVCIDVDRDDLRWVTEPGGETSDVVGSAQPAGDGRWLSTDLTGRVTIYDGETGRAVAVKEVGLPGAVPATAAVFIGDGRAVVPLSDGSAAVVEFTAPKEPKE